MRAEELQDLDAVAIAALVREGEVSAPEVVEAHLARIDALDPHLRSFVHLDAEAAVARAARVGGEPLAGVPFAVKDVAAYPGMRWAMGCRALSENRADGHSAYTQALDDAGLVTLGKTATSELGLLGSTETLLEGVTGNPRRAGLSAAGSSGGAAAAVAAGLLPVAHASDGGGSIRVPAASCGVFGFKPSNGRTRSTMPPTGGLAKLVVDHVVSRTVRDSAMLLAATERTDAAAPHAPIGYVTDELRRPLRIATWRRTLLGEEPDPVVADALTGTVALLESLGHQVVRAAPPLIDGQAVSDGFFTLAGQSVAQVAAMIAPMLGRYPGPDELEPFTCELLEWFRGLPPTAPREATATLAAAARDYRTAFFGADVVLTPTLATPPWPLGHLAPTVGRAELVARTERAVGYTPIHNVAGSPGMSVPLEWTDDGLPIGMHLAAPPGHDRVLLELAYQLETARPWRHRRPQAGALVA